MNTAKQASWFFCLLISLAFSGWYFATSTPKASLDEAALSQEADSVISNLTLYRFDEHGKISSYLQAPRLKHIPYQDTYFFSNPFIVLAQTDQPSWKIRSHQAIAINKAEQITFLKNVVIHQSPGAHQNESTIKTEKLIYYPKDKIATTELSVSFEQPGSIAHSVGMKAYLAEKRIQLLNKARAIYEPKHA